MYMQFGIDGDDGDGDGDDDSIESTYSSRLAIFKSKSKLPPTCYILLAKVSRDIEFSIC